MNKHFRRGQSTFTCNICGRLSRDTGDNGQHELCPDCYELAGLDNMHNDDGEAPTPQQMAQYDATLAYIVSKGGDADKVRKQFSYIWV